MSQTEESKLNHMILLLGLPGGGKSTAARQLVEGAELLGQTALICSTDDLFVKDGVYKFEPGRLLDYHMRNQAKARQACQDGINLVVIDNTNCLWSHRHAYEEIALAHNYSLEVLVVGKFDQDSIKLYAERNLHGVPLASIQKMARRVELPGKKAGSKV